MFETEAQIEEFKNEVAAALNEVKKKGDKIPNPSFKELAFDKNTSFPEMKTAILKKFASLNELNKLDKMQGYFEGLGRDGIKLTKQFYDETVALEENELYTEKAKEEIYKENRAKAMATLKKIAKEQTKVHREIADLRKVLGERAWESIQATTVESLTPNDFAYIDLMLKQGGDRKEIAKRYNYNPRVLDILNAGLTRFSGKVPAPLENPIFGGKEQKEKREYIESPLEMLLKMPEWIKHDETVIYDPDRTRGLSTFIISTALKNYRNRVFL